MIGSVEDRNKELYSIAFFERYKMILQFGILFQPGSIILHLQRAVLKIDLGATYILNLQNKFFFKK